jgi:hypothetical protein
MWGRCAAGIFHVLLVTSTLVAMVDCNGGTESGSRTEKFDVEPLWTGVNNEPETPECIQVDQDFGYLAGTSVAGGSPGEIGGRIYPATTRAYYGKPIAPRTLEDGFSASGRFSLTASPKRSGVLVGWFNSEPSAGWRNNNSLAFRVDGNGSTYHVYFEYGTQLWSTGITKPKESGEKIEYDADGTAHTWSLSYDPDGSDGQGSVRLEVDGTPWILDLAPGHKQEGAVFDRFGLWNRQVEPYPPAEFYLDDLVLDGSEYDFATDPGWSGEGNQRSYLDCEVRPRHNFGYRDTNRAGGAGAGEIGGLVWRTGWLEPGKGGYYADTAVGPLAMSDHLSAYGRIAMTRTCVDAGIFIGWFDTATYDQLVDTLAPENFIGAVVEGLSVEGQRLNASYHTRTGTHELQRNSPKIMPTGESLDWSIDYNPFATTDNLIITLAGQHSILTVPEDALAEGATFDAFGIGVLRKEGHWVEMFVDDITYTVAH